MAIKAIVNNTEKEIEQIKNSDEQDIDYVYSRIGDTEVEGAPPISIKSIGGNLSNYRIYGNTVNGESVGDRTGNLWDGELTDGYHLSDTTGLPVIFARRFATLQPITINQSEYCLTYNSTTDLRFMYSVFNNDTLIKRVAIVNNRYLQSGDAIDTTGGNKIYFAFYNNNYSHASTGMISNIMLNEGSTALPYEPYGYRVPVTVEGKNLAPWDKQLMINANGQIYSDINAYASIIDTHNIDYIYLFGDTNKLNNHLYRIGKSNIVPKLDDIVTRNTSTGGLVNVSDYNYCLVICQLYGTSTTRQDLLNEFMITAGDTVPTKFEPYHAPVTTPIYLPE